MFRPSIEHENGESMILLIGICVLGIAALVGVFGVMSNGGSAHLLKGDFGLFGQHLTGMSTGQFFLFGIIVGLVAALGLSILRGFFTRGLASRDLKKELKKSQAESLALRADFERLQRELVAEKAQNLSRITSANTLSDENPAI